jgi:hypothetical protein
MQRKSKNSWKEFFATSYLFYNLTRKCPLRFRLRVKRWKLAISREFKRITEHSLCVPKGLIRRTAVHEKATQIGTPFIIISCDNKKYPSTILVLFQSHLLSGTLQHGAAIDQLDGNGDPRQRRDLVFCEQFIASGLI